MFQPLTKGLQLVQMVSSLTRDVELKHSSQYVTLGTSSSSSFRADRLHMVFRALALGTNYVEKLEIISKFHQL